MNNRTPSALRPITAEARAARNAASDTAEARAVTAASQRLDGAITACNAARAAHFDACAALRTAEAGNPYAAMIGLPAAVRAEAARSAAYAAYAAAKKAVTVARLALGRAEAARRRAAAEAKPEAAVTAARLA